MPSTTLTEKFISKSAVVIERVQKQTDNLPSKIGDNYVVTKLREATTKIRHVKTCKGIAMTRSEVRAEGTASLESLQMSTPKSNIAPVIRVVPHRQWHKNGTGKGVICPTTLRQWHGRHCFFAVAFASLIWSFAILMLSSHPQCFYCSRMTMAGRIIIFFIIKAKHLC